MPTSISFYARGDGSSANNAALNVESLSQQPVVLLTFEASPGGDIILEANGGGVDPDTTVLINGVRYNFTLELTGGLPLNSNKVPDALEGKTITVISTVINGKTERFFFVSDGSGSLSLMDAFGNGAVALTNANFAPPPVYVCFCTGTVILTPSGYRKIETLKAGEMVLTAQGEEKPILWIGKTDATVAEMQSSVERRPIRIPADAFSPGVPFDDLFVSAQHRIVLWHVFADLLFGQSGVMVRAKHLLGACAETVIPTSSLSFFHVLLDQHDIVLANGLEAESFQPSQSNEIGMVPEMRNTLHKLVTRQFMNEAFHRPDVLPTLKQFEANALLKKMFSMTTVDQADHKTAA
ncbi:MAG: Hint domain-containing protein [Anderseniella sp.]|jgi:hypothetical protein|nr:Hint domain-containing protein [Anderseniella sp.]